MKKTYQIRPTILVYVHGTIAVNDDKGLTYKDLIKDLLKWFNDSNTNDKYRPIDLRFTEIPLNTADFSKDQCVVIGRRVIS